MSVLQCFSFLRLSYKLRPTFVQNGSTSKLGFGDAQAVQKCCPAHESGVQT